MGKLFRTWGFNVIPTGQDLHSLCMTFALAMPHHVVEIIRGTFAVKTTG
jgi:hypothetical protein